VSNPVLLNNVDHHDLRVVRRCAAVHDAQVNQAIVFPTEFMEVQREFPILFQKDESGALQAVALLGLDKGENLLLDEAGWGSRYIPGALERGPFLIGFQEKLEQGEIVREPMIFVDLEHPSVSRTEGDPLFLPQGGNTPYLERVARVLRTIQVGSEIAGPLYADWEEIGLIAPATIEIAIDDRRRYTLPNHWTIDAERLAQLDAATLDRLHRAGHLAPAFNVAASLGNVQRLIELKSRKLEKGAA
jgi:hypothetical protein